MNSLFIDIQKGQKVVMETDNPCLYSEAVRTVIVEDGFGMMKDATGTCIFGKTLDGNFIKIDGMEIEKLIIEEEEKMKTLSVTCETKSPVPAVEFAAMLRQMADKIQTDGEVVGAGIFGDGKYLFALHSATENASLI